MGPKTLPAADNDADDAVIPLQEWLKLLASHGVPMRAGMALAAKAYTAYNTKTKLRAIKPAVLATLVPDKETRKYVNNAIKGLNAGGQPTRKRSRDDDLLHPLEERKQEVPVSFDFNEILDPEALLPVTVTVNRAPIKTAWAYAVARRLGFDAQESLSLAHVYVHISSMKHALALGNILDAQQTREAEEEIRELPGEHDFRREVVHTGRRRWGEKKVDKAVGSSQPWVGLLRAKPVIERPDGTWRAIQKGVAVEPSVGYLYITRALKTFTPHVMGAMQLVAESYTPDELERFGLGLYNEFKPDVVEWGQRGSVSVAAILEQIKGPVEAQGGAGADAADGTDVGSGSAEKPVDKPVQTGVDVGGSASHGVGEDGHDADQTDETETDQVDETDPERPSKKARTNMSVEEYEAMLDAEEFDWDQIP